MTTIDSDNNDERSYLARTLLSEGSDPDPRFTLANERTFLAWTRTSLAFLAGGIALGAVPADFMDPTTRKALAAALIGLGMLISLGAAGHWLNVERALRTKQPLPLPALSFVLSVGIIVACVAAMIVIL